MNQTYDGIRGALTEKKAKLIAFRVNCAHRNSKPVVTSETVFRVASGDYLESHPIDCAILAELRRLK